MLRTAIFGLVIMAASHAYAGAPTNAAHDLAQKFSGQDKSGQAETVATTANTAPAKPTDAKALQATPAKPAMTAPAKIVTTPPQPPVVKPFAKPETDQPVSKVANSERPPLDYEMDMLRRARAEQADRKSAEKPPATAPAKIVVTPPSATSPPAAHATAAPVTATPAASQEKIGETAKPSPTASTVTATSAIAEAQKIVEAPPAATKTTTAPPSMPVAAKAPAVAAIPATTGPSVQASVLLAIETGGASSKNDATSLDPIICVSDTCFLSAGLTADAVKLSKADALKLKSSNDASPDACRGKVGCVFRNVGLAKGALIEVVEIGGASSSSAQTYTAEPDNSCKTSDAGLSCENPIATADFRLWIVPEATAKSAGAEAIEDAVADSLPHRDIARDTDK